MESRGTAELNHALFHVVFGISMVELENSNIKISKNLHIRQNRVVHDDPYTWNVKIIESPVSSLKWTGQATRRYTKSLPNLYQQIRARISVQIRVQFRCISFTQIHALHLVEQPVLNGIYTKSYKFCQIHLISYIKNTQY